MKKKIRKRDKNSNCVYYETSSGYKIWRKFDKNDNLIHYKNSDGFESWGEYDENNNLIYQKDCEGNEFWHKWENNNRIKITEKEYKWIEFKKQEKEYNSRTKCSRFELMEI